MKGDGLIRAAVLNNPKHVRNLMLTPQQHRAAMLLSPGAWTPSSEVRQALGLSANHTVNLLRALERKGYAFSRRESAPSGGIELHWCLTYAC